MQILSKQKITLIQLVYYQLQFISPQCAFDISVISRKPEVHPIIFSGKRLLKNVTLQTLKLVQVS